MKNSILFLLLIILISCNPRHDKSDLIGSWDLISSLDLDTNELITPEEDEKLIVEFKQDSIFLYDSSDLSTTYDEYAWQIEGDSIFLSGVGSIFLKELTNNKLTVEFDFFVKTRMSFIKLKNIK